MSSLSALRGIKIPPSFQRAPPQRRSATPSSRALGTSIVRKEVLHGFVPLVPLNQVEERLAVTAEGLTQVVYCDNDNHVSGQ